MTLNLQWLLCKIFRSINIVLCLLQDEFWTRNALIAHDIVPLYSLISPRFKQVHFQGIIEGLAPGGSFFRSLVP